MLGRVNINESNIIKVFHDGKFYINPISNSWLLENKELISPNHSIMQFDFNDGKEKVLFIDYYTVSEDGELIVSSDAGYANGFQKNLYGSGTVKRTICTKVKNKSTITGATLNTLNRRTFHIKSIWLEKVGS
ncbi:MAG: hypothetical protein ACK5L6_07595 [Anaerorhabdus sp.]|uniref:hypothetical protein n=1 Tax=Anaerorhabdus sp. TaxID=1872524 RepID=UPI003A87697B